MDSKTFWVTRDEDHCLALWSAAPLARDGCFVDRPDSDESKFIGELFTGCPSYAAVGLPREPLPGECWEVTWSEFRSAGQLDDPIMVPCARNVTEELLHGS